MALQGVGKGSDWYNLSYFTGPRAHLSGLPAGDLYLRAHTWQPNGVVSANGY